MEHITANMDQHGRILIPSEIREKLNIIPGDKINLAIYENEVRIIATHQVIDEMYNIFTKKKHKKNSAVDDFLGIRKEEYKLEKNRKNAE